MDLSAKGFALSDELTVYAAYDDGHLKMVGMHENGDRECRYETKTEELITFDDVKEAWKSPTGNGRRDSYLVKDMSSSCSSGILMQQ